MSKNRFEKCWNFDPWRPQFWPEPKNDRNDFEMIFRELSNAAFRFSLRRPGAEIMGGGVQTPPPPAGGGKSRGPAGRGLSDVTSKRNWHPATVTVMNPAFLNFYKLMRWIVRAICISWIFYIRDLRSGQFRDLPMLTRALMRSGELRVLMRGWPKGPPLRIFKSKSRRVKIQTVLERSRRTLQDTIMLILFFDLWRHRKVKNGQKRSKCTDLQ